MVNHVAANSQNIAFELQLLQNPLNLPTAEMILMPAQLKHDSELDISSRDDYW